MPIAALKVLRASVASARVLVATGLSDDLMRRASRKAGRRCDRAKRWEGILDGGKGCIEDVDQPSRQQSGDRQRDPQGKRSYPHLANPLLDFS